MTRRIKSGRIFGMHSALNTAAWLPHQRSIQRQRDVEWDSHARTNESTSFSESDERAAFNVKRSGA